MAPHWSWRLQVLRHLEQGRILVHSSAEAWNYQDLPYLREVVARSKTPAAVDVRVVAGTVWVWLECVPQQPYVHRIGMTMPVGSDVSDD